MRYVLTDSDIVRFWSKVEQTEGCWRWTGSFYPSRRPAFWLGHNNVLAYRIAYSLRVGDIPEGKNLDHSCNNAGCVNPAHLRPLVQRDNVLRSRGVAAVNFRKNVCKRGHPLVAWSKSGKHVGKPWRKCHVCAMEFQKIRRAKRRNDSPNDA